jgi:hypothetical protein
LTCPIEKLVAAWGTKKLADDQGDQGPMLWFFKNIFAEKFG